MMNRLLSAAALALVAAALGACTFIPFDARLGATGSAQRTSGRCDAMGDWFERQRQLTDGKGDPHAAAFDAECRAKPGVSVTREQESRIRAGMTSAEVLAIAGPPAARFRFRVEPGPTWSYQVSGRLPNNYSFDVRFDDAGRVVSASERYTPAG